MALRNSIGRALAGGAAAVFAAGLGSPAAAAEVYCFAFAASDSERLIRHFVPATLYVSPIFESDDPVVLLQALYSRSIPDAGLATCVTDEDEPDLHRAWQEFVANSEAEGPLVIMPLPD